MEALCGPRSTAQGAEPCPRHCQLQPTTQEGRFFPHCEPPPTAVLQGRAEGPRSRPSPFSGLSVLRHATVLVSGTLTLRVTPEPLTCPRGSRHEASADLARPSVPLTVQRFGVQGLVVMRPCGGKADLHPSRPAEGTPPPPASVRATPGARGGPGSPHGAPRPPTRAPWRAGEPRGTLTPRVLSAELSLKVLSVVAIYYCHGHHMLELGVSKMIKEIHLLLT